MNGHRMIPAKRMKKKKKNIAKNGKRNVLSSLKEVLVECLSGDAYGTAHQTVV